MTSLAYQRICSYQRGCSISFESISELWVVVLLFCSVPRKSPSSLKAHILTFQQFEYHCFRKVAPFDEFLLHKVDQFLCPNLEVFYLAIAVQFLHLLEHEQDDIESTERPTCFQDSVAHIPQILPIAAITITITHEHSQKQNAEDMPSSLVHCTQIFEFSC